MISYLTPAIKSWNFNLESQLPGSVVKMKKRPGDGVESQRRHYSSLTPLLHNFFGRCKKKLSCSWTFVLTFRRGAAAVVNGRTSPSAEASWRGRSLIGEFIDLLHSQSSSDQTFERTTTNWTLGWFFLFLFFIHPPRDHHPEEAEPPPRSRRGRVQMEVKVLLQMGESQFPSELGTRGLLVTESRHFYYKKVFH